MHLLLTQLIVFLLVASRSHGYPYPSPSPVPSPSVPITKHTDTGISLYSVNFPTGSYLSPGDDPVISTNFLIDLDSTLIWYNCILQENRYYNSCPSNSVCLYPVACDESYCTDARSVYYPVSSCPVNSNTSILPPLGFCGCPFNVVNPVTGSCTEAVLGYDHLYLGGTCGSCIAFSNDHLNTACAPSSAFKSFPANVTGVMALSSSPYGLLPFSVVPVLSLCLPSSSSAPGVLFRGNPPAYVESLLSYTPLLKQPDSFSYFIGVKAILVDENPINLSTTDTIAKLSTVTPYTTIRTDIYSRLIELFSNATKHIPRVKPVQPFGLCFKTSGLRRTKVGSQVPNITLYLQNNVSWTMFGANSMKETSKGVACLAFVDGGNKTQNAVVIGTQQMEDNFMEIDVGNSAFGFSSSLLYQNTSCAILSSSQA